MSKHEFASGAKRRVKVKVLNTIFSVGSNPKTELVGKK